MDAAKLKEILKNEYGINSEEEFNAAVSKSAKIDIGIFTMPLHERSNDDKEKKAKISA
jgi:hypothetical protein|uniref:Uncharacterized protein n=1 Tax=Myoviridae sp. ct5xZ3 TaxID=2827601 RepID=A0A8S5RSM3_9CAUD|nr:MAG TPA: hypothetical protein [Myoviridae sp. ct5xZ3]